MNSLQKIRWFVFLVLATFLFSSSALASVPKRITYHGLLKDSGGSFLTGTYDMSFRLYSAETGGTALWTEAQSDVSVTSGRFTVELGSVTALNLTFDQDYWLSVEIESDGEMSPRQRLTSVGYAYMAEKVVNAFEQHDHDALSHKSIAGVKSLSAVVAKTNFKLDAYTQASANSMGDMIVDVFNDDSGLSNTSTNYKWRDDPDYDVIVKPSTGGIDSDTVLMLHANGTDGSTTFTDSSDSAKTVTAHGNAQIDTAQSKFGGASALLDGSGDYLSLADSADWDFGTGDFTIDFWIRFNAFEDSTLIDVGGSSGATGVKLYITTSKILQVIVNNASIYNSGAISLTTGTWYHFACSRSGTSFRFFKDGVQVGSTVTSSHNIDGGSNGVKVGDGFSAYQGLDFNGWVDELRISKGVARWTANFTVPSQEYTNATSDPATVISESFDEPVPPKEAMVIVDETLNTGTITYYVSRDDGTTWTQAAKDTVVDITSQPSGTKLRWKADITDDAELNSIAVAV